VKSTLKVFWKKKSGTYCNTMRICYSSGVGDVSRKYFWRMNMSFKIGDKVRRKIDRQSYSNWKLGSAMCTVFRINSGSIDIGDGNGCYWDCKYFDLVPAEVTVSNEVQLPGIPDGYRAVRYGYAQPDDRVLDAGVVIRWASSDVSKVQYLIVEKTTPPEPPKPKTRSVVLNRYLVWDADVPCSYRVVVAEEGYVTDNWQNFTLLGHSETIEVEV
jgi:hypothetical protein